MTSTGNIFSSNFGVGWVKKCSNGIFTANLGTDYDLQYVSDNTKKNSVKIFLEILVKYFNIIFQPQSGRRDDMQFSSKSPGQGMSITMKILRKINKRKCGKYFVLHSIRISGMPKISLNIGGKNCVKN